VTDRQPPGAASPLGGFGVILARAAVGIGLLYLFLVGVSTLEAGIKALGSDFREGLLEGVTNPVAGLFAGMLATVLVQSSSVTTSTLVGLVGSGSLTVEAAAPMIMGANIGTTITNTIVSLGHARRSEEFRRAFAAATMHDFFNILAVLVFFPLELTTGFLTRAAEALADVIARTGIAGGETRSPVKEAVRAPVGWIKDLLGSVIDSDVLLGVVLVAFGMLLIFAALATLSRNMRALIAGRIERAMNNAVARGGGIVGLGTGVLITMGVQSSSITTSIIVPLVGSGVLTVRNAFPITLGANIGTPITALLASLAVDLRAGLVIALHHALFNIFGVAAFYPLPKVRHVPVILAEKLSDLAVRRRLIVGVYVVGVFLILPLAGIVVLR
jgi:sodium-dependent phosphate cotransporter